MSRAGTLRRKRSSRRHRSATTAPQRRTAYRHLQHPFEPATLFSDDRVESIHESALHCLEQLGMKVLLPEARTLFRAAGARVVDDTEMVYIGRELVEAAVASAPRSVCLKAGNSERDVLLELGRLVFQPGAGAPHATDIDRGRRPGSLRDFRELIQLTQYFDVLHMLPPLVEPQDIAPELRHYETLRAQLTLSDKVPFIFSRGTAQVEQSFELLRDFRGLDDAAFTSTPCCYTIVNTNSPRQLDKPMAQGLIDFARAGQVSIVTPFTLMGAMAPITPLGALTLSHAEALAGIALTQLAHAGAPVCYGTFTSNVDMKSGSPAFGTPEHVKASIGAGQLARRIGLPWRCATGSAANTSDVQAANETQFALWGCLLAGATVVIHAAGWLEGGLSVSYEKLVTDCEVLQMVAELCAPAAPEHADEVYAALAEIEPGGHFFSASHTMARYRSEFYEPLVHDWSNFGTWTERGARDATMRANALWKAILSADDAVTVDPARREALDASIARGAAIGGAPPVS